MLHVSFAYYWKSKVYSCHIFYLKYFAIAIFDPSFFLRFFLWFYVPQGIISHSDYQWRVYVYSALIAILQWGFFRVPRTWGIRLYCSSPRTRFTRTCCRSLGNGAVIICFNDLGLLRREIGPRSLAYKVIPCKNNKQYLLSLLRVDKDKS